MEVTNNSIQHIKNLIAENDINEAFYYCIELLKDKEDLLFYYNKVILLNSNFKSLNERETRGLAVNYQDYNQITYNLLNVVDSIPIKKGVITTKNPGINLFYYRWIILIFLVSFICFLNLITAIIISVVHLIIFIRKDKKNISLFISAFVLIISYLMIKWSIIDVSQFSTFSIDVNPKNKNKIALGINDVVFLKLVFISLSTLLLLSIHQSDKIHKT